MAFLNERQWRKAYMLEFLEGYEGSVVKDIFTFSVPPESENFEFPQRVSETKTFGGTVIDDYGNDSVKIRLSGSTINEERKLIYRGNNKRPSYLTVKRKFSSSKRFLRNGEKNRIKNYICMICQK